MGQLGGRPAGDAVQPARGTRLPSGLSDGRSMPWGCATASRSGPSPHFGATADLVFTRARVAVFVDGCFWHGCPEHRTHPGPTRPTGRKIDGTIARDLDTTSQLEATGWTVLRYWRHEDPDAVA